MKALRESIGDLGPAPEPATRAGRGLDRLVALAVEGDPEAHVALYKRYYNRVYSYVRVALDNDYDAEDATQVVFMRMWEALPGYRQNGQSFACWLLRIARNHLIDEARRKDPAELADPAVLDLHREAGAALGASLSAEVGGPWIDDEKLLRLVNMLSADQRQILALRFLLDMSAREIGQIMGRSPEAVRALQYRALRFLKTHFRAPGDGEATALEAGEGSRVLRVAYAPRTRPRRLPYALAWGR